MKPSKPGWCVALTLVAALSGVALLTCGVVCVGAVGILAAAKKPAAQTTLAEDTTRRGHTVGFRRMTLTYRAKDDSTRERAMYLWYPATGPEKPFNYNGQQGFATPDAPVLPGRHPVVLFSHGFLGAADQVIFLTEELAREGYLVAAVNHADAGGQKGQKVAAPDFVDAKSWDESKYLDRRDDLTALLDRLLELDEDEDSFLHHHVDRHNVGAAGHSLGGYTVLGMIGGWESWRDSRVKAALLLSPYALPYLHGKRLRDVRTPVMLQGGTLDLGITPFLKDVYAPLDGPKYYLVLKKESHFAWTNLLSLGKTTKECAGEGNGKLITDYGLAFFNHHLRGEDAPLLRTRAAGLESYEFKAGSSR